MEVNVNLDLLNAAMDGLPYYVKAALKAGADVNYQLPQSGDPTLDPNGAGPSTALFIAALAGHVDIVKLLLREGASLVLRSTGNGYSPLHIAAKKGKTKVVEVLVHHGATVDIKESHYLTPIMYACIQGHVDTVRRLIEFGARVDLVFGSKHYDVKPMDKDKYPKQEECVQLAREALKTGLLRCHNPKCNKPGYRSDLKLCAQCKLTRYCSRECQRQHWSGGHKNCCGFDDVYWG